MTITEPAEHAFFAMLRLRGMIKLEIAGMRVNNGPTAYSQLKAVGYTGNKAKVLSALQKDIEARQIPLGIAKRFGLA